MEDTHPKYDAELYAACLAIIARGTEAAASGAETDEESVSYAIAASFLASLLAKAVTP